MNTQDLSMFGHRERHMAADLLKTMGTQNDNTEYLGRSVNVEFNPMSACVFLVDEDYNVAMMCGDKLEDFFTCPNCGGEGLASEFQKQNPSECCQEYYNEMKEH